MVLFVSTSKPPYGWIKRVMPENATYVVVNTTHAYFLTILNTARSCRFPIVAFGDEASKSLSGTHHFSMPDPLTRHRQPGEIDFMAVEIESCKSFLQKAKGLTHRSDK